MGAFKLFIMSLTGFITVFKINFIIFNFLLHEQVVEIAFPTTWLAVDENSYSHIVVGQNSNLHIVLDEE